MLFANFHPEGVLIEASPNGEAALPLPFDDRTREQLALLLGSVETAQALGALFLAGVRIGERSLATGRKVTLPAGNS
jgi:hypothetical protein